MVGSLETTDLGISATQRIRVLTDTRMPAVLTEIAYISNDSDRKKLTDEEFRTRAARALHDGIIKVLKEMAAAESPEEQNK
jgi:N-acetylmuramoyl-L-alanine amidase